jgi:hypothetical protein
VEILEIKAFLDKLIQSPVNSAAYRQQIEDFKPRLKVADLEGYVDILQGDRGTKFVAECIYLAQGGTPALDRGETLSLLDKIMMVKGTDAEIFTWLMWLRDTFPGAHVTDLIYYSTEDLTAEQINQELWASRGQ